MTRIRLIARGAWTLRAQDPARTTLATGSSRAIDGLNILDQQYFAADLEQEAVQRRLADQIADQIVLQLAAYFRKHATASAAAAAGRQTRVKIDARRVAAFLRDPGGMPGRAASRRGRRPDPRAGGTG